MSSSHGLQFEYVSGCLIVRATSGAKFEQRVAIAEAIAATLNQQPVNAALIDLRDTDGPSTFMDRYQLGELAANYLPRIPIAALMREDQTDKQLIGQLVARNRGVRMDVLLDQAAADEWLKKHAASEK